MKPLCQKESDIACERKASSLAKGKLTLVFQSFPIYKYLGKLNKDNIKLPEEVIITICESYLKNKLHIINKWAWFMITAKECWKNYNARKNISDSAELNKLSQCKEVNQLISRITKGV